MVHFNILRINIVSKGHIDNCRLILDSSIKKIISTIVKCQKESYYFCSLKVSSTVHWKGTAGSNMLVHAHNPSTEGGRRARVQGCPLLHGEFKTRNHSNPLVLDTL